MRRGRGEEKKGFKQNASRGFSLIELMIVIVILGLLASLVMPNIMGKADEAKQKLVCVQMKNISETLKIFRLDNGVYPTTEEGLEALVKNPSESKYPAYARSAYFDEGKMPKDSWQTNFIYLATDSGYDIISLGADRKEGGKDDTADIRYSECKF